MKILYLTDFEIPTKSASSVHVMKMCEAFSQLEHQVTLLCLKGKGDIPDLYEYYGVMKSFNIRQVHIPKVKGRLILFAWKARTIISEINPDIVYSRSVLSLTLTIDRFKGIFEAHKPVWEYGFLYSVCFKRISKSQNFIQMVAISKALKDIFLLRDPSLKIRVAHDAASLSMENNTEISFSTLNYSYHVGYIGSIYRGRGIELIVELARRVPSVCFHIVGGSISELAKLGIREIPINLICHGYVSPASVYSYRKKFNILLAPYQRNVETIGGSNTVDYMSPLKIFEYMSERKVIIASDLPVLREVLNDENAILVKPESVNEWVDAIEKATDVKLSQKLADSSYSDFINFYTWKARAKNVLIDISK